MISDWMAIKVHIHNNMTPANLANYLLIVLM